MLNHYLIIPTQLTEQWKTDLSRRKIWPSDLIYKLETGGGKYDYNFMDLNEKKL